MTAIKSYSSRDMGGVRISNLGTPLVASDAATKGYVDAVSALPSRLGPASGDINSVDLNTLTTTGFYSGFNLGNSPGNSPSYFHVEVQSWNTNTDWVKQIATGFSGGFNVGGTWERVCAGGAWEPWRKTIDQPTLDAVKISGNLPDVWQAKQSSVVTLTTATLTNLPGLAITFYSNGPTDKFIVECSADALSNNGSPTLVLTPYVDGARYTNQGDLNFQGPIGSRTSASQTWLMTGFSTGSHTIQMTAQSTGAGNFTIHTHTTMTMERLGQQFGDGPQVLAGVWMSANSASGFTSVGDVPFNSTQYMLGGITYSTTTREFTIPTTGTYLITGTVRWQSGSDDTYQYIWVNNVEVARSKGTKIGGNVVQTAVSLAAGDKVRILTNTSTAGVIIGDVGKDTSARIVRVAGSVQSADVPQTNATLTNGWSNYDTVNFGVAGYEKVAGRVNLCGNVKGGATGKAAKIMTLPPGCRPLRTIVMTVQAWSATCDFRIDPDGSVYVFGYDTGGNNGSVSLDAVNFVAKQ